jgi:uncharacterized protein (DUF433 family)
MSQAALNTIELRPNRSGQPRVFIAGTRVRVQDIYGLSELQGKTPDEIVAALPHLTLHQVHSALAFAKTFCRKSAKTKTSSQPFGLE